jgi:hypothetical protein
MAADVPEPTAEPIAVDYDSAGHEPELLPVAVGADVELMAVPANVTRPVVSKLKRFLRRIEARRLETAAGQWHSQR